MTWIVIIIILGLGYLFLVAPSLEKRKLKQKYYAHRGLFSADQAIKENSLEAFQLAVAKGYGIELDVQLTKDDQVVVYHDDTLFRLEHDERFVHECTFEELRPFQLPLFTEALQEVQGKVDLIVELKTVPLAQINHFCEKVYATLKEYPGSYCIESFNPFIVAWFRRHAPEVTRGQLVQPIKVYPNIELGLFLNTFLYQFLSRPHFIAFEATTNRWNLALWLNKWLGAKFVMWTVAKPEEAKKKNVAAYIFEHCEL